MTETRLKLDQEPDVRSTRSTDFHTLVLMMLQENDKLACSVVYAHDKKLSNLSFDCQIVQETKT